VILSNNHLSAANRRFQFPSGALLYFKHSVCARSLLMARWLSETVRHCQADMKNIVLSSRQTDRKALLLASIVAAIAVPLLFDSLPNPTDALMGKVLNSVISLGITSFVWAGFRLLEPKAVSHKWALAELVSIPTIWGLLFWGVTAWVHQIQAPYLELMEKVHNLVISPIA
jgi:hypothetical protein